MGLRFLAVILFATMILAGSPAWADSFSFASSLPNYDGGSSGGIGIVRNFCVGANCITASGFLNSGIAVSLSQKSTAGDMGLGIYNPYASGGHNEIQVNDVVQLNLHGLSALNMGMSSLSGDSYIVWGSNSANCLSSTVNSSSCAKISLTGNASIAQPFTLTGFSAYQYLYVSASNGDVLVNTLTTTSSVPELGSFLLLGSGLLGIGQFRKFWR